MKRFIFLFWRGLTGIIATAIEWIINPFCMKNNSKKRSLIYRFVETGLAICVFLFALSILLSMGRKCWRIIDYALFQPEYVDRYDNQELSRYITYHEDEYGRSGYIFNKDKKILLKGIAWIAMPLGEDSLVCYSDGQKRGYFNMYTGQVSIKPTYSHAYIFSENLASVDDNGWIKFIDPAGRIVIDNHIPYRPYMDGYVFHNGHCAVHNDKLDKLGLIDKQGKWALQPEYTSIEPADSFWIVSKGKENSVLNANLETILPFMNADFCINNNVISAEMSDHTIRTYSLTGEIIEDFYISDVTQLYYDTNEIFYSSTKNYDEEGNLVSETVNDNLSSQSAIAHCRRYQAEYGWFGLMSPNGHVITPPSYSDILAIGPDLYLCKTEYEHGIIMDGKGNRVK